MWTCNSGFSGIAIIVRKLTRPFIDGGIPLGVTTFVLNIPFFIISWFKMGKAFVKRTFAATVFLSLWLMILPQYSLTGNDYMLTAIAGGVTGGAGIGLVCLSVQLQVEQTWLPRFYRKKFLIYQWHR